MPSIPKVEKFSSKSFLKGLAAGTAAGMAFGGHISKAEDIKPISQGYTRFTDKD